jgi:pimeloyl-ACP methyl ester carboxylesterase
VFVHGVLVNARLWEPVAERLAAEGVRSYAPTLPLGAHQHPMNADADLSPQGIAKLMADFMAALGLSDVTIVGNDTGGAICQVMLGADTSRIGAAVLTDCDALGTFPPRAFAPLFHALRHPGLVACLAQGLRSEKLRHGALAYGPLTSDPLDRGLTSEWVQPLASKTFAATWPSSRRRSIRASSSTPPAGSVSSRVLCGSCGERPTRSSGLSWHVS